MSSDQSLSLICKAESAEWLSEVPDPAPSVLPARSAPSGPFEIGLYYAAADLQQLAEKAPENKRAAVEAIVRLVRSLAET